MKISSSSLERESGVEGSPKNSHVERVTECATKMGSAFLY